MLQDPSTHARESISKLECLYEANELGSKQRAVAYDKYVSLKHSGYMHAVSRGIQCIPRDTSFKMAYYSPLWTFLVKKIESSIKVELLEHLRG